jgi:protein-tyrosine phosphatase
MTKPARLSLGIGCAGFVCATLGVLAPRPASWMFGWCAGACVLVAAAYARNWPGIFGKRGGALPWSRTIVLLPYLAAFRIACALMRWWRGLPVLSQIVPGLYVGGRMAPTDLPAGVALIVDLTCELSEPAPLRAHPGYRCVPVLDGAYPSREDEVLALLREIAVTRGGVVVHCESGKGRAPTVAALALMARGEAADPAAAMSLVRRGRPWAAPTAVDLRFLERLAGRVVLPPARFAEPAVVRLEEGVAFPPAADA